MAMTSAVCARFGSSFRDTWWSLWLVSCVALSSSVRAQDASSPAAGEPPQAEERAAPAPASEALVPPQLLESPPPVFPASELASGAHPTVVLQVTVFADGTLGDLVVEHPAGPAFDNAAVAAVKGWKFAPAKRGDAAIASRVSVAVHFELPELGVHEVTALGPSEPALPHAHRPPATAPSGVPDEQADPAAGEGFAAQAQVVAPLRQEGRGAADFRISGQLLRAAPALDAGELLKRAPGLVVTRPEGEAVGQRLSLRGFDIDHGQDLELNVDGVPVNQPSHIHGQGYTDLGFVIPETVRSLRVTEGTYDPRQGDFAMAGSADLELGVEERGVHFSSGYGSFHTFRELALYAPPELDADSFGAVMFRKTDGFGQNRAARSAAAVAQLGLGPHRLRSTFHASVYAARADSAGVVRRDDVEAGRVGFYDVYPFATTRAQGASSARAQLSLRTRYRGERGENAEWLAFLLVNSFAAKANYTGFAESRAERPDMPLLGDLIDQQNLDRTLGVKGRYRSPAQRLFDGAELFVELGTSGRFDSIEQTQDLVQAPQNRVWEPHIDAHISALDVAGYLDLQATFWKRAQLRGGLRADLLSYQVEDRLAHADAALDAREPDRDGFVPGNRRAAAGFVVSPRAALEVEVLPRLSLLGAYGHGFRSPMALLLQDGGNVSFSNVRSGDLGAKLTLGPHEELELRVSGYTTHLSKDVLFDPHEGRAATVGSTRRLGAVFYGLARPWPGITSGLSVTYVHAAFTDAPEPDAADPDAPVQRGRMLPYMPPVVIRADLGASRELFTVGSDAWFGTAGAGFSYWAPRPLPFGGHARSVSVLDAELGARYRIFALKVSCSNLLDAEYAAVELQYPSSFAPSEPSSARPARHIAAGAPRTFFTTFELSL